MNWHVRFGLIVIAFGLGYIIGTLIVLVGGVN